MNAAEFHKLFLDEGARELPKQGYVHRDKAWHLVTKKYWLAFFAADTRLGLGIGVKYLTLTLVHLGITDFDGAIIEPYKRNDLECPLQISPSVLRLWRDAQWADSWHYTDPREDLYTVGAVRRCYLPIHYSGDQWLVLQDPAATDAENQEALHGILGIANVTPAAESDVRSMVVAAVEDVLKYGQAWADSMSPRTLIDQLKKHGSGKWYEKHWIREYNRRFGRAKTVRKPRAVSKRPSRDV